jgi:hypothetical protein
MVPPPFPDLTSQAGGTPWGVTRSWTNGANYSTGLFGTPAPAVPAPRPAPARKFPTLPPPTPPRSCLAGGGETR